MLKRTPSRGFVHRDIKPSNFLIEACELDALTVPCYIVDFGLAKKHLDDSGKPIPARETAQFRGSSLYASLNAHEARDLSRRDDLWSLLFILIDFSVGNLPWRYCKDNRDAVESSKRSYCGGDVVPRQIRPELQDFMRHLKTLQ